MKKFLKTFIFVFAIIFVVLLSNVIVKADTGPKPYVSIKIIGNTQGYYMTLISRSNQCGPYSNNPEYQENIDNIDLKFAEYEDSDGYYYLYYQGPDQGYGPSSRQGGRGGHEPHPACYGQGRS